MVSGGSAIRGTRIGGGGPSTESERGEPVPRVPVSYWCLNKHESRPYFAVGAEIPDEWECPSCGLPAGRDPENPPKPKRPEPYKTHFAYVKERRTDEEGAAILAEALERLRKRREGK